MKKILNTLFIVSAFTATGCANNSTNTKTSENAIADSAKTDTVMKVFVDTLKPNTDYKPAFAGQTRIARVSTTTPYQVDRLNEKIGKPWSVNPLPDGRLVITDKSGFIGIYSADGAMLKKITGLPKVDDRGQGGLLDLALDPDSAKNNTIYWTFSEKYGKGNLTAVAKGILSEADSTVKNATVIFRATPALKSEAHFGSRLLFDKEGYIFVTAGERSILDGRKLADVASEDQSRDIHVVRQFD